MNLHEDERYLEHAPMMGERLSLNFTFSRVKGRSVIVDAHSGDLGMDTLVGHDSVHESEATLGFFICNKKFDAVR